MFRDHLGRHLNNGLVIAIFAFLGIGLMQVYSSSYIFAIESYGDGLYFFKRQLAYTLVAIVVLLTTVQVPFRWVRDWGWLMWVGAALGVAATYVPGLGVRVGGALRWIQLPLGVRFEPAEVLKLSFGVWFASVMCRQENILRRFHWGVVLALSIVPLVLLLKQPDFGSFAIIVMVAGGLLFAFGLRWKFILTGLAIALPSFYLLVMRVPYRRARVLAFLDPWSDPEQKGFQVIQSMLSFHSGGLTGAGLGQGQGKLFFLPEAHTDFTLAVLGEEMGFLGFLLLLALYFFIVFRGFQIGLRAQDKFRRTVALGITATFGLSVFINTGVVMGLLPTKGLTLPFLSYGGSSLVALCFMMGILINIENSVREEEGESSVQQVLRKKL